MLISHMNPTNIAKKNVKISQPHIVNKFIPVSMQLKQIEQQERQKDSVNISKKSVLQKEGHYTKAMISFRAIKSRRFPMMKLKLSG